MSICVEQLYKSYAAKEVLRGLTLHTDGPLVLMGPSGCGKTTLLRILMGLEPPDAGRAVCGGRVAAVFQEDRLCPQLSAEANLCLVSPGLRRDEARRELCALGFTERELALPAGRLSGGQKRRAALLRALLCREADTLLLDEPFTGMDAELVRDAAAAAVRLCAGRDAILVTHDGTVPALLGWPVYRLENGTIQ